MTVFLIFNLFHPQMRKVRRTQFHQCLVKVIAVIPTVNLQNFVDILLEPDNPLIVTILLIIRNMYGFNICSVVFIFFFVEMKNNYCLWWSSTTCCNIHNNFPYSAVFLCTPTTLPSYPPDSPLYFHQYHECMAFQQYLWCFSFFILPF